MAKKITAIRKLRPEIEREPTRQMPQVVEDMQTLLEFTRMP